MLAFAFSLLSLVMRAGKALGTAGMAATLLGGSSAEALAPDVTPLYLGLDFFVLRLLFTGLVFIPIETLLPRRSEQGIFRAEWRQDLFYYLVSSMLVQLLTFLSFLPANSLLAVASCGAFREAMTQLPFAVQLVAIMFLTDLVQYRVHRLFHRIPALWRFHAVHHSAKSMDWMAGARMHFLEILVLRGATVIPMIVLGFSQSAVHTYIFVVYLYATFVHSNLGARFRFVEKILVTPRFHPTASRRRRSTSTSRCTSRCSTAVRDAPPAPRRSVAKGAWHLRRSGAGRVREAVPPPVPPLTGRRVAAPLSAVEHALPRRAKASAPTAPTVCVTGVCCSISALSMPVIGRHEFIIDR